MHKTYLVATLGLGFAAIGQAAELQVTSGLGYDSNPYRLSDAHSVESDSFWRNSVKASVGKKKNWFASGRLQHDSYLDNSDADQTNWQVKVGYKGRFSPAKHFYRVSLEYRDSDKTYVSRFSGKPYSVGGISATDRYDYQRWAPKAELYYNLSKHQQLQFKLNYRQQDYSDYTNLGLSDLDFSQAGGYIGWRHKLSKKTQLTVFGDYQQRDYDNRLAKDIDGDDIAGLTSEYTYKQLGVKARYKLSKATTVSARVDYTDRQDNGDGYYDTETFHASLQFKRITANKGELSAGIDYRDLGYTRSDINDDLEQEGEAPSTKGYRIKAGYKMPAFTLGQYPVIWYNRFSYEDYDADVKQYVYDRMKIETGLQVKF